MHATTSTENTPPAKLNGEGGGRYLPANMKAVPFWAVHGIALFGVIFTGWSWKGFALAIALYYARMFFVTAGYHRYFSHKSYKTSRWFQFVLAFGALSTAQKGVLWWASHHRWHHRFSDKPEDVHSAKLRGLWWSHAGWILSPDYNKTDVRAVSDLARYPELMWLERWMLMPTVVLAVVCALVGGWEGLLWGYFVSTSLLWHGTFTINSLSHKLGSKRYKTSDESRNNFFLAILTMGEGWHNNHHRYQSSARQGFFWWEIDLSYYILRALSAVGIVWDLKAPPARLIARGPSGDELGPDEEEPEPDVASDLLVPSPVVVPVPASVAAAVAAPSWQPLSERGTLG